MSTPCPEPTPCPECPECPELGAAVPTWLPSFPTAWQYEPNSYTDDSATEFQFEGTPQFLGYPRDMYAGTPPPIPTIDYLCPRIFSETSWSRRTFFGGILGDPTGVTWAVRWEFDTEGGLVPDTEPYDFYEVNSSLIPQVVLSSPNTFTSSQGHQVVVLGANIMFLPAVQLDGGAANKITIAHITASRGATVLGEITVQISQGGW